MSLTGSSELREVSEAGGVSIAHTDRNKSTAEIYASKFDQPYIYKVHQLLRNVNPGAYEPNIIAIGPYHRGKDKTRMMETHKERYMKSILHRNEVTVDEIFSAVKEISSQAMAAYADYVEISSSEFVKMLVMDGCFIVELALMHEIPSQRHETDPIFQMDWMMKSVQRDLMLFENQIPFFVLCKIYEVVVKSSVGKFTNSNLFLKVCKTPAHDRRFSTIRFFEIGQNNQILQIHHLYSRERRPEDIKHLLDLIHGSWEPPDVDRRHLVVLHNPWRNIGSVTYLREANVRFRRLKNATSMFQIEYADGILSIPAFSIDHQTDSFIRNLIAYEQYHPVRGRNFFTDYAVFLNCLINSSADVKYLHLDRIVENCLGDDEAVARYFNKITESVSRPELADFRYGNMFISINKFCDGSCNRYIAILKRDYFNSPWSYFSFVAAVVLLVLTVLSTIFTGMQTYKK